jgi:hypothetical protein
MWQLCKWGNNKSIASSIWLILVTFSTMRRPSTNEAETLRSVTTYQSLVSAPNLEKPSASCKVRSQHGLQNRSRGLYVLTSNFLTLFSYSLVPYLHQIHKTNTLLQNCICPQSAHILLSKLLAAIQKKKKKNSMVWVRERTIPTERPPLVSEAIANFCG